MTDETNMSSEKIVTDVTEEALESTDEALEVEPSQAEESESQAVPVAKHVALRHRAQTAEIEAAELRGRLSVLEHQKTTEAPPPISPYEREFERQKAQGIIESEDDMVITLKLQREQKLYEQQVANQQAHTDAVETLRATQLASANQAKVVHDDWSSVVMAADGLLDKYEQLKIADAGADFGEVAYTLSKAALERNAKPVTTIAAPETKPSKPAAGKMPTQQEILDDLHADPQAIAASLL